MSRTLAAAAPLAATLLVASGSACVVPRSMGFGQGASALPSGVTELATTVGLQYATQSQPPVRFDPGGGADVTTTQVSTGALSFPAAEANLRVGLSKLLGLNFHLSGQGLQPGLKITLVETKALAFAILPAIAFGVGTSTGSTEKTIGTKAPQQDARSGSTDFLFGAGLKAIFSHSSGFYGGLGYDFVLHGATRTSASTTAGGAVESIANTSTSAHQLLLGVGMGFAVGGLHIRPELAVSFVPGLSVDTRTSTVPATAEVTASASGGSGFAIFPSVTFAAAATPPKPPRSDEDGEGGDEGEGEGEGHGEGEGTGGEDQGQEVEGDDTRSAPPGRRPARAKPPPAPADDTEGDGEGETESSASPPAPGSGEGDEEPAPRSRGRARGDPR